MAEPFLVLPSGTVQTVRLNFGNLHLGHLCQQALAISFVHYIRELEQYATVLETAD